MCISHKNNKNKTSNLKIVWLNVLIFFCFKFDFNVCVIAITRQKQFGEAVQLPGVVAGTFIDVKYKNKYYLCEVTKMITDANHYKNIIIVKYVNKPFSFKNTEKLYIGDADEYDRIRYPSDLEKQQQN